MVRNLWILIFILIGLMSEASEVIEKSQGTAKDGEGNIVYIEKHISRISAGRLKRLETSYFSPQGDQFGFIKSDFSSNSFVPSYMFEDKRHQRFAGVQRGKEKNKVLAYAKSGKNDRREEKTFDTVKNSVTGQGLHNFLRTHLTEFKNNIQLKKEIRFLIPMNQDEYDFRIRATNYDKSNEIIKLRIEADSWLFRLLAPHIDVTYDTKNNRLLKYEGPSNLLDENGDNINVEIGYKYDEV